MLTFLTFSQIGNRPRCYGRTVTNPMTLSIYLQPLPNVNLALKKFLADSITGREFGIEIFVNPLSPLLVMPPLR